MSALNTRNNKQAVHCEGKGAFGILTGRWGGANGHHKGKEALMDATFQPQAINSENSAAARSVCVAQVLRKQVQVMQL